MIDARDLSFAYPRGGFALNVRDLQVAAGERVAVIGPSGTGKTTLLNLLAGLAVPDGGRLTVAGTDLAGQSDGQRRAFRARRIGFIFQNFALVDYLDALENILYPYRVGVGLKLDAAARDRARLLAEACGTDPDTVDTNIVVVEKADAAGFVARAKEAGVLVATVGPTTVRLVTHLDVSRADAERAASVLAGL